MDREDILANVVAGDWDDDTPELQEALRRDPTLAEDIMKLRKARSELDALGQFEREILSEALTDRSEDPVADKVEAAMRQRLAASRGGAGPRSGALVVWLAAAAIAVAAFGVWQWSERQDEPVDPAGGGPTILNDGRGGPVKLSAPADGAQLGRTERIVFRWSGGAADATYRVEVFAGERALEEGLPILDSGETSELSWTPSDAELDRLRAASDSSAPFVWRTSEIDASGLRTPSSPARFSLR